MLTPSGPRLASELAVDDDSASSEAVFAVRTISGHEVRASAGTVFRTPDGDVSARDLRPGDQVYLQSNHGFWNPSDELPAVVGESRSFTPALGALLGRLIGSGWMRSAEAGSELVIAFPKECDPARVQQTRLWLSELLGCASRWLGRADGLWLTVDLREVQGLSVLGLPQALSSEPGAGRGSARVPEALFRAPEAAVHAFLRTIFEDLAIVEEQAVRLEGTQGFLSDLQELLSYLGVLAIRWESFGFGGAELILPPKSVAALPPATRPESWQGLGLPSYRTPVEPCVTTVSAVVEESANASCGSVPTSAMASMRGFLVKAS
ncbi:MAG: hypothetical protein JNM84_07010 [Planctomycetes bacterium]|nr:hypothetical protein [Planctomycetota bacterium]